MATEPAKRGRKPKSAGDDPAIGTGGSPVADAGTGEQINGRDSIDPGLIGEPVDGDGTGGGDGGDGDGGPRRRKGRSDAGKPRGARSKASLDLTDLKDILVLTHAAIAMAFGSPKIEIDADEGEKLAAAVQKVVRHYDLPDVASETKDWIGLLIVASSIYGPRVTAAWADKQTARREEQERRAHPPQMTVVG